LKELDDISSKLKSDLTRGIDDSSKKRILFITERVERVEHAEPKHDHLDRSELPLAPTNSLAKSKSIVEDPPESRGGESSESKESSISSRGESGNQSKIDHVSTNLNSSTHAKQSPV